MRAYISIVLLGIPLLLGIIALANFFVDPGSVYLNKIFNSEVIDSYTQRLAKARFGMIQEGWNEREVKLALAKRKNPGACIVLGSSQIMAVSILQGDGINSECENLVNLGVSGASLEDLAIFSETLIESTPANRGNRVYIAVSPWLFNFNKDRRYLPYEEIYTAFRQRAGIDTDSSLAPESSYYSSWLSNLISSDYFSQVLRIVRKEGIGPLYQRTRNVLTALNAPDEYVAGYLMPEFDLKQGASTAVTLSDGSHVYTREFIQGSHDLGGGMYKLNPEKWADEMAIELFEEIIEMLKKQGIEVVLLFTPYHYEVWEKPAGETARKILTFYRSRTEELARKLNVRVLGSYNPADIACARDEFYDFMHPSPSCLNKIFLKDTEDSH